MLSLAVLWLLLAIAAATDIARHEIYNWNTYPGIAAGIALSYAGLGLFPAGVEGGTAAAFGFLACGLIMLTAFVFFEIGGGDVKMMAMIGAFFGVERGIEVLLWTFSIGFVVGVSIVIWQTGIIELMKKTFEHARIVVTTRQFVPLTESERKPLKRGLFLAPSALAAVTIVMWRVFQEWFDAIAHA